jgi:hypothetical protein
VAVPREKRLEPAEERRAGERRAEVGERAVPEVHALNQRSYDRYRRYGFGFDDTNFKMDFTNGVLIYTDIKGDKADPGTRANNDDDFTTRQPNITVWYGVTEAPDETA